MQAKRTCGGCTACCKTHPIKSIGKQNGVWCEQCAVGVGCKIYDNRPSACRKFQCQWLKGWGSDADRPDLIGLVVDWSVTPFIESPLLTVALWEVSEGGVDQFFATHATMPIPPCSMIMAVYASGRSVIFLPPNVALSASDRASLEHAGAEIQDFPHVDR